MTCLHVTATLCFYFTDSEMLSKFPKITPLIYDIGDLNPGLFIAEVLEKVKLEAIEQRSQVRWCNFLLSPVAGQQ